jgi:pectate lyase
MKIYLSLFFIISLSIAMTFAQIPSFPGAEGFGRYTTGGRGGKVYYVTTLEDGNHKGTFRYAISQDGPRTIVFNVSGTIFLKSNLKIIHGDVTIAGQTAPGKGICVAGGPVTLNADNIIIRYLRFRVGDKCEGEPDGLGGTQNKKSDHRSLFY